MQRTSTILLLAAALFAAPTLPTSAQNSELEELKAKMKAMEQTMEEMKQKIAELEKQKAPAPAPAQARASLLESNSPSVQTLEKVAAGETVARQSPVEDRGAMNDQQTAASRPKDFTLDPTFQGFIPCAQHPCAGQVQRQAARGCDG